ncbi:paraneoplastic antigen Ma3 homolog [Patiria miniata]|uniref:CCHC-type domain-containing protein n=1 Tax=Patiria miniata TaxID=46514 RepID=A0A914B6Z7_PATMI|nr:paraneoplastic antigen Ma3 homolog [Patiria miniata]
MSDSFSEALNEFLSGQGKTLEDLKSLGLGAEVEEGDGNKPIVHVIDKGSSRSYRRLRLFSGKSPVPSGELDFENWRRLAHQLLKDENIPDGEKKSRITESLVPPALNVVWAVEDGSPAHEYLTCLSRAYGSTADGDELLTNFRCTYQKADEKASDYLLRLHTLLTQVVEMDGINPEDSDKTLCSQFQRGCLYNDPLLSMLQLRAKKDNPPGMLHLLREVRAAEALLEEKSDRRKSESKPLKKVTTMAQTAQDVKTAPSPAARNGGEVAELRQTVDRLHRRLDGFFKNQPNTPRRPSPSATAPGRNFRSIFCYQCGEDNHRMDSCSKPKNPALVQEKMMLRLSRPKSEQSSENDSGQL